MTTAVMEHLPPVPIDDGELTVLQYLAAYTWGSWDVTWPESYDAPELDHDRSLGFVSKLPGPEVGRFSRRFVRADAQIDAENGFTNVEQILDDAAERTEGDVFFQRDISQAELGRLVPGYHFRIGDLLPIRVWGGIMRLPVTAIDEVSEGGVVTGYSVHVGGQLVSDRGELEAQAANTERQIARERRERARQVKAANEAAGRAQSTADAAYRAATDSTGYIAGQIQLAREAVAQGEAHVEAAEQHAANVAGLVVQAQSHVDAAAGHVDRAEQLSSEMAGLITLGEGHVEAARGHASAAASSVVDAQGQVALAQGLVDDAQSILSNDIPPLVARAEAAVTESGRLVGQAQGHVTEAQGHAQDAADALDTVAVLEASVRTHIRVSASFAASASASSAQSMHLVAEARQISDRVEALNVQIGETVEEGRGHVADAAGHASDATQAVTDAQEQVTLAQGHASEAASSASAAAGAVSQAQGLVDDAQAILDDRIPPLVAQAEAAAGDAATSQGAAASALDDVQAAAGATTAEKLDEIVTKGGVLQLMQDTDAAMQAAIRANNEADAARDEVLGLHGGAIRAVAAAAGFSSTAAMQATQTARSASDAAGAAAQAAEDATATATSASEAAQSALDAAEVQQLVNADLVETDRLHGEAIAAAAQAAQDASDAATAAGAAAEDAAGIASTAASVAGDATAAATAASEAAQAVADAQAEANKAITANTEAGEKRDEVLGLHGGAIRAVAAAAGFSSTAAMQATQTARSAAEAAQSALDAAEKQEQVNADLIETDRLHGEAITAASNAAREAGNAASRATAASNSALTASTHTSNALAYRNQARDARDAAQDAAIADLTASNAVMTNAMNWVQQQAVVHMATNGKGEIYEPGIGRLGSYSTAGLFGKGYTDFLGYTGFAGMVTIIASTDSGDTEAISGEIIDNQSLRLNHQAYWSSWDHVVAIISPYIRSSPRPQYVLIANDTSTGFLDTNNRYANELWSEPVKRWENGVTRFAHGRVQTHQNVMREGTNTYYPAWSTIPQSINLQPMPGTAGMPYVFTLAL